MVAPAHTAMKGTLAIVGLAVVTSATQDQTAVFRRDVDAVRVDVSVMSGTTSVRGLTAANVDLSDNGVPQAIARIPVDTVPLSIMLVLDTSGDLRALFATVHDELRSRYLLTYYPKGVTREGWHTVKVGLKDTRGEVTARPGYFIAPAQ